MKKKVLFLLPYPLHSAPSQRFRVEAFFHLLEDAGIEADTHCFFDKPAWDILYKGGSTLKKAMAVMRGYWSRLFKILFHLRQYDFVFIHREAAPLGPPLFEWLIAKVFRKKVIYDFDDAIWIPTVTKGNYLARWAKCFWKIKYICKWAHRISPGNDYLAAYARKYNSNVSVVPTCVDTVNRFNRIKDQAGTRPVIGWTGSHSTLKYLDLVQPVLQKLAERFDFDFLVICDRAPVFSFERMKFREWKESSEIEDLLGINIGLMPLVPDAWSEGKCGFKIIQYLSLGIPAVASPVGVNKLLVKKGETGFPASSQEEWYHALALLLQDEQKRKDMGANGMKLVRSSYSISANASNFLSLFS